MKKIPCLFKRDWSKKGRPLLDEVLEGSEWVINGDCLLYTSPSPRD